ncbi:matrixin family metalloprotease [Nocardioides psychrotolerans]|uniref:matrixin family metalloprotease n=1 Tax=Nocardioides psychrotolerans TaxID=1005945 RepID=UPI00313781CC
MKVPLALGGGAVVGVLLAVASVTGDSDPASGADEGTPGPHHAFFFTQPGSSLPVTWSSCHPVTYVVNPAHAPAGWVDLVASAVDEVAEATGLDFAYLGTTSDRAFNRSVRSPTDFEPVLIGWAMPQEISDLEGTVAGVAGPDSITVDGHTTYVTGKVILDAESYARLEADGDEGGARAILMHELGHVMGLAHVDDAGELMHEDNIGRETFGPGDLQGLAVLGAGRCVQF